MRIVKCDRCGQTIPNDLKPWAFAICDSNTGEPYPASPFKGWDFCLECKDEIIEFVKAKKKLETPEIAGECHCAVSTVSRILAELKEQENKK